MSNMNDRQKIKKTPPRRGPGGGPGMHGGVPIEKAKNFKESFKRLVGYVARRKGALLTVIIMAAGSAAFAIIGPKILGNATTPRFLKG